jgi:glycosyltransferase involved in cell wall biosynthesis
MSKLPISVCIVSGAEAHRIGKALESVVEWVSEIIVVLDDRAQDDTEAVVARYGGRVFREPWKGFIGQKNSVMEKASQPWVLGLDADEVVSPSLQSELHRLFATAPPAKAGYSFPRCTFYLGRWIRHGDWYPDRCTRLWQRGRGRWAGVDPHAKPEVDGPVAELHSDLLHYSMESYEHLIAKTMAYADEFAKHCAAGNQRVTTLDLMVRPTYRFFRAYVFRLGFLDSWQGYSIAWMTAFYTFLRYAKVKAAQTKSVE